MCRQRPVFVVHQGERRRPEESRSGLSGGILEVRTGFRPSRRLRRTHLAYAQRQNTDTPRYALCSGLLGDHIFHLGAVI
eukprot:scaffold495_cov243-Pinguiococcus_pyrenoidosus.AAC.13